MSNKDGRKQEVGVEEEAEVGPTYSSHPSVMMAGELGS